MFRRKRKWLTSIVAEWQFKWNWSKILVQTLYICFHRQCMLPMRQIARHNNIQITSDDWEKTVPSKLAFGKPILYNDAIWSNPKRVH